jgi:low density lipoprotein-related protein 2
MFFKKKHFSKPGFNHHSSVSFRSGTNVEFSGSFSSQGQGSQGEQVEGDFNLGEFKPTTDFSNPMYEALDANGQPLPEKPSGANGTALDAASFPLPVEMDKKLEQGSAVLSPSAVVHRSSPQVQVRQFTLNPTSIDTDKDTQQLVEEDKSEC